MESHVKQTEVATPGISWTKWCPVAGPLYSKKTYDKMSPSCDFVLFISMIIF